MFSRAVRKRVSLFHDQKKKKSYLSKNIFHSFKNFHSQVYEKTNTKPFNK